MHNTTKHITPFGNYDAPSGWPMKPYKRPYGGTPDPPVMYEKPSDPEEEGAGYGYSNGMSQQERDVFYYHSDHLGSTSYITDRDGNATQFVCYKPYGEALVDEHNTSYEQPWKFNGKELDSETGLYYYGARYYEPVMALWYGVDALAEKYPNMGGYVYCNNNPIKIIDPDGNDGEIVVEGNSITINAMVYIYGGREANSTLAATYQQNIENTWGKIQSIKIEGKTYSIHWNVKVQCKPLGKENYNGYNNYMEVIGKEGRSSVTNNNHGKIRLVDKNEVSASSNNPMAHEFGHMLGLADRYKDKNGTDEGWNGNIMGSECGKGVVENRNIESIVTPAIREYKQKKSNYESEHSIMSLFFDYKHTYKINYRNAEKK